ncbi:Rieske 2Fe-2S domain-containing protein [Mycobacterium kiyosense]
MCFTVAVPTSGARPVIPNYPRDCWYVAATGDEITREPFGRRLLNIPIVLYRLKSGQVVALDDACGHRS